MIFVDRKKEPVPAVLIDGSKERKAEKAKVDLYLKELKKPKPRTGKRKKPASPFKLYNHPTVKPALIRLFDGKCAYCESSFRAVYIGDVEHFRPKGEIKEEPKKEPGYYWLAASWDNLLLSCRNCNQLAKHEIEGKLFDENDPALGKMNQFPLSDPKKRVRTHTKDVAVEEPYRLLVNPCIDDPEDYFEYDEKTALIKPKKGTSSTKKAIALTSIEIFVLHRAALVSEQNRKRIDIEEQKWRIETLLEEAKEKRISAKKRKQKLDQLDKEIAILKRFIDAGAEYLALARQLITSFLAAVEQQRRAFK